MAVFGLSDPGKTRVQNQDCFAVASASGATLMVVADGIGGHKAGDIASKLACNLFVTYFKNHFDGNPEKWFRQSLKKVNAIIYGEGMSSENLRGMGTTVVAAVIIRDEVWVLNVGDSRAYYLTVANDLIKITDDHSLANDLIIKEGLTPMQAEELGRHIITRAVGIWPQVEGDIYQLTDRYRQVMLCTDGLHNYVSQEVLRSILSGEGSEEQKCQRLIDAANQAGGFDNVTAVLAGGE